MSIEQRMMFTGELIAFTWKGDSRTGGLHDIYKVKEPFYISMSEEVDVEEELWEALKAGKMEAVDSYNMHFLPGGSKVFVQHTDRDKFDA